MEDPEDEEGGGEGGRGKEEDWEARGSAISVLNCLCMELHEDNVATSGGVGRLVWRGNGEDGLIRRLTASGRDEEEVRTRLCEHDGVMATGCVWAGRGGGSVACVGCSLR